MRDLLKLSVACSLVGVLLLAMTSQADAPPGRYYVDAKNGTVYDTKTGLTWTRAIVTQSTCPNLTLDGGGWRLPTVQELLTLVDPTRSEPAIDVNAFPNTPFDSFYCSPLTTCSNQGYCFGYLVNFRDGSWQWETQQTCYTRCVR